MTEKTAHKAAAHSKAWAQTGRQPRIAIIGAGMSGIAAVVKLQKAGYTDVTVYEKTDRVGGTWRENTYPGLSCDVPSRWYSFYFALKPDWPHRYSYGADIQAYLEQVAEDFGVTQKVTFNTAVAELTYEAPCWRLLTSDGKHEIFDVVISATGILHQPQYPEIKGLDTFRGACFHTARWDHSKELKGQRVGIIGTGSTACQIVGAITEQVSEMHVFQRTAHWLSPLPQIEYSTGWNRLMSLFPVLQRLTYHYYCRLMVHTFSAATVGNKFMQRLINKTCVKHLEDNVPDPALRARLTPAYDATCKRLIFCSDFYPAISRPNAHLITGAITQIEAQGIRTADGKLHELDALILATGFNAAAFVLPARITGENGVDLETQWDGAPRAHRAVALPSFPNFWMVEGPTGPVGNLSLIAISEHQVDYIVSMLDHMREGGLAAIAAKQTAYNDYNAAMTEAIKKTTWATGGCTSWYFDKSGVPNLYPWAPLRYLKSMRNPDYSEYHLIK
ncbi:MAG: NAD(P)/FAD-dependent oxidoreductase [Halioglobus sp.]|nr:NAD(P)/FAD-dependent oxidoreductase [Halioglobus sp.]